MYKTHKQRFLKSHSLNDKPYSLKELSKISQVPLSILQEVYNRGIGAYKNNPTSVRMKGSFKKNISAPLSMKLSKEQWAFSRVYSFLDGNLKHDNDLRGGGNGLEYNKVKKISDYIRKHIKGLIPTGSLKRKAEFINDIDYLTLRDLDDILAEIEQLFNIFILKDGDKHKSILIKDLDIQIDFWKASNKYELFYKKFLRDLDKGHSIYYKKQAQKAGYKLTEVGLYKGNDLINLTNRVQIKKLLNI